jgi:hypothetical protein
MIARSLRFLFRRIDSLIRKRCAIGVIKRLGACDTYFKSRSGLFGATFVTLSSVTGGETRKGRPVPIFAEFEALEPSPLSFRICARLRLACPE